MNCHQRISKCCKIRKEERVKEKEKENGEERQKAKVKVRAKLNWNAGIAERKDTYRGIAKQKEKEKVKVI